jgi:hypothetical protein
MDAGWGSIRLFANSGATGPAPAGRHYLFPKQAQKAMTDCTLENGWDNGKGIRNRLRESATQLRKSEAQLRKSIA